MTDAVAAARLDKVLAWDGPTRLFKWGLVAAVASAWVSDELAMTSWHVVNGKIVLALVVFRLLWGVVGGSTARFSQFLRSPAASFRYGLDLLKGREGHYLGHNPLGAWMVVALIGLAAVMGISGLFNADYPDRMLIDGPFAAKLSDAAVHLAHRIHSIGFKLLELAVLLHVAAVGFHAVVKKDPLIPAMVTGRKPPGDYVDAAKATPGSIVAAIVCLAVAVAIVWGGIALAK
ncbi:MAG: cytochrome b/b6 domain-containing protein [Hyphomicrobiales bacterium]|nr:cytochrome b/b6 domain-containing protein [Hyphomicrobiales bacterium]